MASEDKSEPSTDTSPQDNHASTQVSKITTLKKKRAEIEDKDKVLAKVIDALKGHIQALDCKRFDLCRDLAEVELYRKTNTEYAQSLDREIGDRVSIISEVIRESSYTSTRKKRRRQ
jgi:hypothetical protein